MDTVSRQTVVSSLEGSTIDEWSAIRPKRVLPELAQCFNAVYSAQFEFAFTGALGELHQIEALTLL